MYFNPHTHKEDQPTNGEETVIGDIGEEKYDSTPSRTIAFLLALYFSVLRH